MDYFPAWKVRLVVRLEDFGSQGGSQQGPEGPRVPTTALRGVKSTRAGLEAAPDPSASAPRRFRLQRKGAGTGGALNSPQERRASSDGLTFSLDAIVPSEAKLELNGLLEADTLELTIAFDDAPFLPEALRSVGVEYYLGVVTEEDAAAVHQGGSPDARGKQLPMAMIAETFDGGARSNMRFQGWVDEWETTWPEDGAPVVTLKCRDNSALMIDQDAPQNLPMDIKLPLSQMFATYLANFPQLEGLVVEYRGNAAEEPTYEKVISKSSFRPSIGGVSTKGAGQGKTSVWDVLTDYARSVGHVVRVVGSSIIVQTPTSAVGFPGARADDPFGRVRKMVVGRNVSNVSFKRSFGTKAKAKNIEARSYVPDLKKTIVKRYPEAVGKPRSVSALPGDGAAENKYTVVVVNGIKDEKTVLAVAKGAHEMLGRVEVGVSLATSDLSSYEGVQTDPDLLDLQPGDPLLILRAQDAAPTTTAGLAESAAQAEDQLASLLRGKGFDPDFSAAYARAYLASRDTSVYRMRKMTIVADEEEGVAITAELSNYVMLREDPA